MKYFIVLVAISFSTIMCAQIGHLGKTTYLNYTNGVILFGGPTYNVQAEDYERGFMNMSHEFSFHKIISKKHEIIPFYSFNRSSFYYSNDLSIESNTYNKIVTNTLGASFRMYLNFGKSWNIAPFGNYIDIKPFYSNSSIRTKSIENEVRKLLSIQTPGLAIGIGRQRVVKNRLMLNWGLNFALPFNMLRSNDSFQEYIDERDLPSFVTNGYIDRAVSRNFRKVLFEMNIGIGLLLF